MELHSLNCSPNIVRVIKSRRLRWSGQVARMEEGRSRWEDNIRMDLKEVGINTRNWVDSAQDRELLETPPGSLNHGVSYLVSINVFTSFCA